MRLLNVFKFNKVVKEPIRVLLSILFLIRSALFFLKTNLSSYFSCKYRIGRFRVFISNFLYIKHENELSNAYVTELV